VLFVETVRTIGSILDGPVDHLIHNYDEGYGREPGILGLKLVELFEGFVFAVGKLVPLTVDIDVPSLACFPVPRLVFA
jgi:hypothetical protein